MVDTFLRYFCNAFLICIIYCDVSVNAVLSQVSRSAVWALRARMRAASGGWRFWTAEMLRIKSVWRPARARSPAVPSRARRAGPTPKPGRWKSQPQTLNTVSLSNWHFTQNNSKIKTPIKTKNRVLQENPFKNFLYSRIKDLKDL